MESKCWICVAILFLYKSQQSIGNESKQIPYYVDCKRAQSSGTVPYQHQRDRPKSYFNGRRCLSLSPTRIQKKCNLKRLEQSSSTPESPIIYQEQENTTNNNQQRLQGKFVRNFASKKRDFLNLRKNLISQQNILLEQYADLKELESKVGVTDITLEEMRVLSLKGWPPHDLLLLIRDDLAMPSNSEISGVLGPHVVQQIQAQLNCIPQQVMDMASEIMKQRLELLKLLRSKHRADRNTFQANMEWKSKNTELDEETDALRKLVAGITDNLKAKIISSLELAKISWKDRDVLIKKIDKLQKENAKLQTKLEDMRKENDTLQVTEHRAEEPEIYQDLSEELKKERSAKESLREVVAAAENMLRVARNKITALEKQLKEKNSELELAQRKHKDLEQLYQKRGSHFDTHSKKLIQVSKTGEITIESLSRQRDALEIRVRELRDQATGAERAAERRQAELRARIDSLLAKVAQQEKTNKAAEERIFELENHIKCLEEKLSSLKESSSRLTDLQKQNCADYVPSNEREPSCRETELWKELQATREALARTEDVLRQYRAEKDNFLDSLSQIAQCEGLAKEERLAAELVNKEKKINELQQIISEHQDKVKALDHSAEEHKKRLGELRLEVMRLRNYDCYSKEVPYQDLQNELMDLQTEVVSLYRERQGLMDAVASKTLMLERYERAADHFVRVTRARKELEGFLEDDPFANKHFASETTRSLTSICASGASVWSALKNERSRVLQLENAVLSQNVQLEREQRVRTQLERRRSVLERELIQKHSSTSKMIGVDAPNFVL